MEIIAAILIMVGWLTGLFALRTKLVGLLGLGLKLAFPLMIVLVLSGLFVPQIYEFLADQSLRRAGLLTGIQEVDGRIGSVSKPGKNIVDNVLDLIGQGEKSANDAKTGDKKGILERTVYDNLVSLFTLIYRLLAVLVGLAGMLLIIYLSYAVGFAADYVGLQTRVSQLEARLTELEQR